ncbi:MAG TPA: phosphate signaling complex protein PhoU [Verrucomicrobiae bacterium]|nr:phosphate signaling complex protein PhoU [Verrucomicrobiae bacterium]
MTSHLEKEINELKDQVSTMAGHAEAAATRAVQALVERNDVMARAVIENDEMVDRLEMEIDERVVTLLSKALLATDLRTMTVAMKLAQDLERVADEATTIARRAIALNAHPANGLPVDIPRLGRMALGMLKRASEAFVHQRPNEARAVVKRDKEVDALNKQFHRELTNLMLDRQSSVGICVNLMAVSKSLERIADHATNVAEEVVYLYEAHDIRHASQTEPGSTN